MYRIFILILFSMAPGAYAAEPISFKKDLIANTNWSPYVLVFLILCLILILLSRHAKKNANTQPHHKIIQRIARHNKTSVFVLDYNGQQFLLADNQHAIAIHPLNGSSTHEK